MAKTYWEGSAPVCDFCGAKNLPVFVDGKTKLGPWAIMCHPDFRMHGVGLGVGKGQKYARVRNDEAGEGHLYVKVEG